MNITSNATRFPATDNECTELGWTELLLVSDADELHVSVLPGTDLDSRFKAFCHDEQEIITVNGWLFVADEL